MYSSLHSKIATLYSGKKYALLSSIAMGIYLKGYRCQLLNPIIKKSPFLQEDFILVDSVRNHYESLIAVRESRGLNFSEKLYMAKFCYVLRTFLKEKNVGLVLLHNDLRWHHAIAIAICKQLGVKYLVTEQGLFRPTTTIMDNCGVNANSSLINIDISNLNKAKDECLPAAKNDHNSFISMIYFTLFLLIFKLESVFRTKIPYQHNSFSLKKYFLRFKNRIIKGAYNQNAFDEKKLPDTYIFIPLQLENDTQMLIHSVYKSNQYIISELERQFSPISKNIPLVFKKHPNDTSVYSVSDNSMFVEGPIVPLAERACLCITVNSSASIDIITTNTPLLLLGESIYNFPGIAKKVDLCNVFEEYLNVCREGGCEKNKRDEYIFYLKNIYSVHGAGFSYEINEIKRALQRNFLL